MGEKGEGLFAVPLLLALACKEALLGGVRAVKQRMTKGDRAWGGGQLLFIGISSAF